MGRNFANKLWNAARFVLTSIEGPPPGEIELQFHDRWIRSRFESAREDVTRSLEGFNLNEAATRLYDFVWHDFCDWYIELVKGGLQRGGPEAACARSTLAGILDGTLRLLHPFVPFITEELWAALSAAAPWREGAAAGDLLILAPWPEARPEWRWIEGEKQMDTLRDATRGIRNIRNKMNIERQRELRVLCAAQGEAAENLLALCGMIQSIANVSSMEISPALERPPASATHAGSGFTLYVPLAGLIDLEAERARLEGQREKILKAIRANEAKLGNDSFVGKAPADVVERVRTLQAEAREKLQAIEDGISSLA